VKGMVFMVSNVSFASMFNLEAVSEKFASEQNIENIGKNIEGTKISCAFPDDVVGRSQVRRNLKIPHKLKLSSEDANFLAKLNSNSYGFHGKSNAYWVHSREAASKRFIMGDGRISSGLTRHDFINGLVDEKIQAFQIAGNDAKDGENVLTTLVKNPETNKITMYICDSKGCASVALPSNIDFKRAVAGITDNLSVIIGATAWKK